MCPSGDKILPASTRGLLFCKEHIPSKGLTCGGAGGCQLRSDGQDAKVFACRVHVVPGRTMHGEDVVACAADALPRCRYQCAAVAVVVVVRLLILRPRIVAKGIAIGCFDVPFCLLPAGVLENYLVARDVRRLVRDYRVKLVWVYHANLGPAYRHAACKAAVSDDFLIDRDCSAGAVYKCAS